MGGRPKSRIAARALVACALLFGRAPAQPDHAREAAAILARCTPCHGEERQRKGLRLDDRAALLRGGRSGPAIVPGDPDGSLLVQRVAGVGKRMPPEGEPLGAREIAALRAWIVAGAPFPETPGKDLRGFADRPLRRPPVPAVEGAVHPIDAFVRARLRGTGLSPAPRELPGKLLRRLSLDLVGLPPTPAELDAFEADPSPAAYARAIDRLLASPHFGERQAAAWLDLGRYADTQGYEKDRRREIWRYRDFVIEAFAQDMPYDEFTIHQLAGDLLPEPTVDHLIATAFHRNTMTNDECGTDDEEFRVAAVADRVETTMTVWLGATFACCRCHDHPYDPFSQVDYFRLFAFFDNTEDDDHASDRPTVAAPTRAQQEVRERLLAALPAWTDAHEAGFRSWLADLERRAAAFTAARPATSAWRRSGPYRGTASGEAFTKAYPPEAEPDAAEWTGVDLRDGELHALPRGDETAWYLACSFHAAAEADAVLALGCDEGLKAWWNGAQVFAHKGGRAAAPDQDFVPVTLRPGENRLLLKVANGRGAAALAFSLRAVPLPASLAALLAPDRVRDADAIAALRAAYREREPSLAAMRAAERAVRAQLDAMPVAKVPVLRELPPDRARVTRVHRRGNFLDPGEVVERGVPAALHPWPEGAPRDRLGLARWLVGRDGGRAARVAVNRFWAQLFGTGLVETCDDFGTQGEPPSHPELLDWLAAEFVDGGWSVKRLLRTIVTSETYQQRAWTGAHARAVDPHNRLLARGPGGRLPAEMLRDQALAVAGLLSPKIGGPSVMPPQPEGLWQIPNNEDTWVTGEGEDRVRRSLYTFWRRTSPYPALALLDVPSREVCVVQRGTSTTPLQALVTWNDPSFVAAAVGLAERMARAGDVARGVTLGFRLCTGRTPSSEERDRLVRLHRDELARGDAVRAFRVVATVLLNLDETLTRA